MYYSLRIRNLVIESFLTLFVLYCPPSLHAQTAVPPGSGDSFKDTSILKPPIGSQIAIIEFEDLECPYCARSYPIIHAAIDHYHLAFVHKDFPLARHVWSFNAALWARYIEDRLSPISADAYRGAIFAEQTNIATQDDLMLFTKHFLEMHSVSMPSEVDPTGRLAQEVNADKTMGQLLGVIHTPTIIICSDKKWVQVTNIALLNEAIRDFQSHAVINHAPPANRQ